MAQRQFEELLQVLRAAGAEVVDGLAMAGVGEWRTAQMTVLAYEFKHDLNAYLGALADEGQPRNLAELIEYNVANTSRAMPLFGQEVFEAAQAKGALTERDYLEASRRIRRMTREDGIDALLQEHSLDALIRRPSTRPT